METSDLEIILGTYEEYLLGYKYSPKSQEIKQTFATHSHSSSIRTVCTSDKYLASGGADDRIFIYDLKQRREHSVLTHHNGTINCLAFTPEHKHLLSGSSDGMLAVVRTGNWQVEKIWKDAHKGSAILSIAVHPTGKFALSLGTDHTLCTWNLIKGRQAYVINLNSKSKDPKSLEHVQWASNGTNFLLFGGKYTEVWSIQKGGMLKAIQHSSRVTCCKWLSKRRLLVGYENGKMATVNTDNGKIKLHDGHSSRVKAMDVYGDLIVTAASSGDIKIWSKTLDEFVEHNCGCRITCLSVSPYFTCNKAEKIKDEPELADPDCEEISTVKEEEQSDSDSDVEIVIVPRKKAKKDKMCS